MKEWGIERDIRGVVCRQGDESIRDRLRYNKIIMYSQVSGLLIML